LILCEGRNFRELLGEMSLDQIGQYERNKIKERNPRSLNEQSQAQSAGAEMKACFGGSNNTYQTSNGAIGGGKDKQLAPQQSFLQQQRESRTQSDWQQQQQQQQEVVRSNRGQANRQAYNILTGESH